MTMSIWTRLGLRRKVKRSVPSAHITLFPPEESGFLPANNSMFEAELYVAAMARSGSTVLCDLMTYQGNLCLIEPCFMRGATDLKMLDQFHNAGIRLAEHDWKRLKSKTATGYSERYMNMLAPALLRCDRWGAKEVRPEYHVPTIATLNPKRVLVLVRDARDVAHSLFDKVQRDGGSREEAVLYVEGYLPAAAQSLETLAKRLDVIISRYEDFTCSQEEMRSLATKLDWPLLGRPNSSFVGLNRVEEANLHKGAISKARTYRNRTNPGFLEGVLARCAGYQKTFAYR